MFARKKTVTNKPFQFMLHDKIIPSQQNLGYNRV